MNRPFRARVVLVLSVSCVSCVLGFGSVAACSTSNTASNAGAVPTNPLHCQNPIGTSSTQECLDCQRLHCLGETSTCFGNDGTSGSCGAYATCANACACTDAACLAACKPSGDCQTCLDVAATCTRIQCATECAALPSDAGADATADGAREAGSDAATGP